MVRESNLFPERLAMPENKSLLPCPSEVLFLFFFCESVHIDNQVYEEETYLRVNTRLDCPNSGPFHSRSTPVPTYKTRYSPQIATSKPQPSGASSKKYHRRTEALQLWGNIAPSLSRIKHSYSASLPLFCLRWNLTTLRPQQYLVVWNNLLPILDICISSESRPHFLCMPLQKPSGSHNLHTVVVFLN